MLSRKTSCALVALLTCLTVLLELASEPSPSSFLLSFLRKHPDLSAVDQIEIRGQRKDAAWGSFRKKEQLFYVYYEKTRPKSGSLSVMVVFESSGKVNRVLLPEHRGVSSRLSNKRFLSRFSGRFPMRSPLELGRDGLDAVTGATLSSKLVVGAIRRGAQYTPSPASD